MAQLKAHALPGLVTLLSQLVSTSSISSPSPEWDQGNTEIIHLLASWFEEMGFSVDVQMVPGKTNKANMIATLGKGPHGLVLSGHSDTVPFDQSKWQSDPFILQERDHRLHGLGSCDMKGFFALIVEALRGLDRQTFAQPLIVLATADEESTMSGARALAKAGSISARAAVIGEPTGLKPIRMHKGVMMNVVRVTGKSGHSSNPALGVNAIEGLHHVIAALMDYRKRIQSRFQNTLFTVSSPTMNFGRVHGGDSPNRICGHCELSFDLRPLPGMSVESLYHEIGGFLGELARKHDLEIQLLPLIDPVPPFETAADAELVRVCESLTGFDAEAVAFATEAPLLQSLGMETIVLGAGSIDQAHQPNEFLALDQIQPMTGILQSLISQYCINVKEGPVNKLSRQ